MSDLHARAIQLITNEPDLCLEIAKVIHERTSADMGLTERQAELLQFIRSHRAAVGMAPSYTEMANHMRLVSRSGINRLVCGLEERGAIRRLAGRARAIEIVGSA